MTTLYGIIQIAASTGDGGPTGRTLRFIVTVPEILSIYGGNVLEIGAGTGESTVRFLKVAKGYGRNVVVVDPFEDGWDAMPKSYGQPYPYEKFQKNTEGFQNLILIKAASQDEGVDIKIASHGPYAFSFVDGLQFAESVMMDLKLMDKLEVKVICVDDYKRLTGESEVPLVLPEFLSKYPYTKVSHDHDTQEIYLIRNDE